MINPERYGITIITPDYKITADANTASILTGEHSGADELTDLGISYRKLNRLLREELAIQDARSEQKQAGIDPSEFHLVRPGNKQH